MLEKARIQRLVDGKHVLVRGLVERTRMIDMNIQSSREALRCLRKHEGVVSMNGYRDLRDQLRAYLTESDSIIKQIDEARRESRRQTIVAENLQHEIDGLSKKLNNYGKVYRFPVRP